MNPNTTGDEYAVLTAAHPVFETPSATLPEGLRGEQLKITSLDPEAEGQIELILGSYLTDVSLGGATGGTFTLSFGADTTSALAWNASAVAVQAALEALPGIGAGNVDVTLDGSGYHIALRGTLYLTDAVHFTLNGGSLTGGGATSATINASSIKLGSAWSVEPQAPAGFEVGLFSDVRVPDVKVTVYAKTTSSVVVFESDGSTAVTQGDTSIVTNDDSIQVRLSSQPSGPVSVNLGDDGAGLITYSLTPGGAPITSLPFTTGNWDTFQTVWVRGVDDGVIRGFHRTDLSATAAGYNSFLSTVTIGDDNYPGVTVTESGGSTNVIEYQGGDFGVSQTTAAAAGLPFQDSYTLALTEKPAPGEVVTVTVQAQPTRTSQTGGIVSFSQQLQVCVLGSTCQTDTGSGYAATQTVTFDDTTWDVPFTVWVRAVENDRVDGGDTHVFAPELNQLNAIQGPLFVNGGEGVDRTGLLEREPVMLPGETNLTPSMGHVISSTPGTLDNSTAATVTIEHSRLATIDIEQEAGTGPAQQDIAVNATSGTFRLSYNGVFTGALAYNAPSVTVENALRTLVQAVDSSADVTVAQNGNVYQVTILHPGTTPLMIGHDDSGLGPLTAAALVNETILITDGPAKNKSRIVTGAIDNGDGTWTLTLDKPWFSPFTGDSTTPTHDSTYTLLPTNPNLLVTEQTQANLLFLYDTDNPASYDDPAYVAQHPGQENPFGAGQIFYDTSQFGPKNESGIVPALDQFRITGFGMGPNRCIGGPSQAINGSNVEANACSGPVGANEPGGITFQSITDLQLELGAGDNHVTLDTFTNVPADTRAPQTQIDTGAGNDLVDLKGITSHAFINLGAGNDTLNVHNDAQTLTEIAGLLTASGDSPQANVVNFANGSPKQGTAVDAVDAIQMLTVQATGGSYTLTYVPQPLNVTAAPAAAGGSLAAGSYFYEVTAITPAGETIASPEASTSVTGSSAVNLSWYAVPGATSYKIYRGTSSGGENTVIATGVTSTSYTDTGAAGSVATPPSAGVRQTVTLAWNASPSAVASALEGLSLIGAGNVDVQQSGGLYRIHFENGMGGAPIALLATDPTNLTSGAGEEDVLNVSDTGATADDAALLTSTSLTGLDMPGPNTTQELVVDATAGTYTLTYQYAVNPTNLTASQATGGTLHAGTHYYVVTGISSAGESLASNEASAVTAESGAVSLTWIAMPGATDYKIYRGSAQGQENTVVDTGSAGTTFTDLGGGTAGTPPATSNVVAIQTTAPLVWNASAAAVQSALTGLSQIGVGNVVVTQNDDTYVIAFQGSLSDSAVRPLIATASLQKSVENLGGGTSTVTGTATVSVRAPGSASPAVNQVQILNVTATGGTYELQFHVGGVAFTTAPIAYNAGAEQLRQTIQNAIAAGESSDPNVQAYLVDKLDVWVSRYPSGYLSQDVYVLNFQGQLRKEQFGPGLDTVAVVANLLTGGSANVTTRMDGIDYYGFEQLNIATGSGSEVFNVQGTTQGSNGFTGVAGLPVAQTNISLNNGDDRVYMSSDANLDQSSWNGFDFLTGNLDDFRGALNVDFGNGRQRLFISDEASTHSDNYTITDTYNAGTMAGLTSGYDIYLTRVGHPGIAYKTSAAGNLFDGVDYWTGSGDDTILIDGTQNRAAQGQRTTTILDTGLGNDNVTVNLTAGQDGFFVLETSGGPATADPVAHSVPALQDNDTVNASGSSLPLIIIGGYGNDTIRGGSGNDIIVGDLGIVQYALPGSPDTLLAQFGFGGRGDVIDAQRNTQGTPVVDPRWVYSRDLTIGGNDTIYGNGGEDILIGGAGNDRIDGGTADDLIFGDAVQLFRRDVNPAVTGNITSPRFQALSGTQVYPSTGAPTDATNADNNTVWQNYRDGNGTYAPDWAEYTITLMDNSFATQAANDNSFGNDYIAGGAGDDMIFGELGNDVIQGDGSIDYASGGSCTGVGATWNADSSITTCPSFDAPTDGSDYIEGGGGNDVIFGNQGQDDIIGGNSNLFGLTTPTQRPDGTDLIFGGSGLAISQDNAGDTTANGHANDSDAIIGDNGDIVRLVATNNATAPTGFLSFGYDNYGTAKIVPRAITLLDYTPGGPDYNAAAAATDIGAPDVIHGENGDDFLYGEVGNDVIYGDGQNDTIVGGYGADWISGGSGDDGILGDDGRIVLSRVGTPELLAGPLVPTGAEAEISIQGGAEDVMTNVTDTLLYTADLAPDNLDPASVGSTSPNELFVPLDANDIIYGGLGNDSIHGGAGDDAISGAEALPVSYTNSYALDKTQTAIKLNTAPIESDYYHPYNPGNVLGYSAALTYQAQYDPNDPFREILLNPADGSLSKTGSGFDWLLNFNSNDGPVDTYWAPAAGVAGVPTDGNDSVFGDLGNDWLVGGTGRDSLWGGWGNDYLNADDVPTTNGGLNTGPDTNPSYEDFAYGGAGLDVLLANTGGDRLLDWSGEFDSYLVPFDPFGMATISRDPAPHTEDLLYAFSKSEGADPLLASVYSSDPTRNGEPFGEIGLVNHQDAAWGDQHGGPRDPQPGHEHGHRDVLRTSGVLPIGSGPGHDPVRGRSASAAAGRPRSGHHRTGGRQLGQQGGRPVDVRRRRSGNGGVQRDRRHEQHHRHDDRRRERPRHDRARPLGSARRDADRQRAGDRHQREHGLRAEPVPGEGHDSAGGAGRHARPGERQRHGRRLRHERDDAALHRHRRGGGDGDGVRQRRRLHRAGARARDLHRDRDADRRGGQHLGRRDGSALARDQHRRVRRQPAGNARCRRRRDADEQPDAVAPAQLHRHLGSDHPADLGQRHRRLDRRLRGDREREHDRRRRACHRRRDGQGCRRQQPHRHEDDHARYDRPDDLDLAHGADERPLLRRRREDHPGLERDRRDERSDLLQRDARRHHDDLQRKRERGHRLADRRRPLDRRHRQGRSGQRVDGDRDVHDPRDRDRHPQRRQRRRRTRLDQRLVQADAGDADPERHQRCRKRQLRSLEAARFHQRGAVRDDGPDQRGLQDAAVELGERPARPPVDRPGPLALERSVRVAVRVSVVARSESGERRMRLDRVWGMLSTSAVEVTAAEGSPRRIARSS